MIERLSSPPTPTFRTIIVPLDGSELAEQALPIAEELSRRSAARLVLLRVHERSPMATAHVLRPSRDLGRMARAFEPGLPKAFRFLTRGLGTRRMSSPDVLSLVMFQPDYLQALVDLGECDAESQVDRISAFVDEQGAMGVGALSPQTVDESSRVSMI